MHQHPPYTVSPVQSSPELSNQWKTSSGSSVFGRPHLSKSGPSSVRAILYMAAIVAIRYNKHIKALYERLLAKGKSKMSALGAAMRKLVHLCFGVLKTGKPYCADYGKIKF